MDDVTNLEKCEVINKPGNGMIGIFSSGTLSSPKVIYLDEKTLIDKVFESNYVNDERIIYNTAPLSTVSGLFTNVFAPFVSNNTKALLNNRFSPILAAISTDVYLPRNYADTFINTNPIDNKKIKRIFTYGEQNSFAIFDFIREKISDLPQNVFVNVYGTTECGGLVSEIEEKDMKELHIYYLDILKDMVIYSYDDQTIYKKIGNDVTIIDEKDKQELTKYYKTKYLPCGFISNKIKIKDNNCIGECLVNDFNTGDIITIIDDKFYVIGRKNDLDKNHYLANYDSELSSQSGRICATFIDDDNNLCVAIRCSLDKEDNVFRDHTTYFRRLLTEAPKIRKFIQERYPNIKKMIFLPNFAFKLSAGIKKSNRKELNKYLKYGEMINERIDHFDEILIENVSRRFKGLLGYVPDFKITENHDILVNKKQIKLEQIVELLNDLYIVMVDEEGDYYKLFYDDSYFFSEISLKNLYIPDDDGLYDEARLTFYRECARFNIFIEKLAIDNNIRSLNIDDPHLSLYKYLINTDTFFFEGTNKEGKIILIPYYCHEVHNGIQENGKNDIYHEQKRIENRQKAMKMIKDYKDYEFHEFKLSIPLPTSLLTNRYDILFDVINVNDDNNGDTSLKNHVHRIIKNTYLLYSNSVTSLLGNNLYPNNLLKKY